MIRKKVDTRLGLLIVFVFASFVSAAAYWYPGEIPAPIMSVHMPQATSTEPVPTASSTPASTTATTEKHFSAYITGYGWPDNTPPGVAVSNPVIHETAGGTGTFNDPITLAVGHRIVNGKDYTDYPAGTKFYIPNLRKYFIVEDTCGDGNTPQNGPCHTGYQGNPWLDIWVGGEGANKEDVFECENQVTGLYLVIQNPASNYVVIPGAVFSGTCAQEFGDTIRTR